MGLIKKVLQYIREIKYFSKENQFNTYFLKVTKNINNSTQSSVHTVSAAPSMSLLSRIADGKVKLWITVGFSNLCFVSAFKMESGTHKLAHCDISMNHQNGKFFKMFINQTINESNIKKK